MQRELVHPPVEDLRGIKGVLGRARQLVDPAELLGHAAGVAEIAEHFAIERQFIDPAGESIGRVQILSSRPGSNADSPRRTGAHGSAGGLLGGWLVSHPWPGV